MRLFQGLEEPVMPDSPGSPSRRSSVSKAMLNHTVAVERSNQRGAAYPLSSSAYGGRAPIEQFFGKDGAINLF